jgi:carbonic anhydrase
MKKTYLLFAGLASVLFGCKKDYTCSCSWTYTDVNTTTGQVLESSNGIDGTPIIIKDVKKKAKEKCEAYSYVSTDTYTDSYTGETFVETYTYTCSID